MAEKGSFTHNWRYNSRKIDKLFERPTIDVYRNISFLI